MIVLLFAAAREFAGTDRLQIELLADSTVGDLRSAVACQVPELTRVLPQSRIAVNREFADDTMVIPHGAEVALIPPVSGG